MKDLITIIVPVYNAREHLSRCIDSIIKQTYKNLEILLINDGSSDTSLDICKQYQTKDNRIKIINKKNTGVSDTRNTGIDNSIGKYIAFVDADDYIDEHYINNMYNVLISSNSDMVISSYTENNGNDNKVVNINDSTETIIDITFPKELDNYLSTYKYNSCWKQMISKELIEKYNIRFNKDFKYGEDMLLSFECYINSKKTIYVKNYGYYYCINENSVMNNKSIEALNKYYDDNLNVSLLILKKYNDLIKNNELLYYKTLKVFDSISSKCALSNIQYAEIKETILNARNHYNGMFNAYKIFKYGSFKEKISLWLLKHKLIRIYYILKRK